MTVVDINGAESRRVGAEIGAGGGAALVLQADVTRSNEVAAMVNAVLERWGTVDILVNAAGGFHRLAPITDITDEEWGRVIDLNLSAFLCARAVVPVMMEKKRTHRQHRIGRRHRSEPVRAVLPAVWRGKGRCDRIHQAPRPRSRCLRYNGQRRITGYDAHAARGKVRDAESIRNIASQNPMKCLVEPEDTAQAVVFLASNEARHITGVNLNVNAGNLM